MSWCAIRTTTRSPPAKPWLSSRIARFCRRFQPELGATPARRGRSSPKGRFANEPGTWTFPPVLIDIRPRDGLETGVPGGMAAGGVEPILPLSGLKKDSAEYGLSKHQDCPMKVRNSLDRKSTRLNSSHLGISYAV